MAAAAFESLRTWATTQPEAVRRVALGAALGGAALVWVKKQILDPYRAKQRQNERQREEAIQNDPVNILFCTFSPVPLPL